jgi:hypothetical protein
MIWLLVCILSPYFTTASTSPLATLAPPAKGAETSTPSIGKEFVIHLHRFQHQDGLAAFNAVANLFFVFYNIPALGKPQEFRLHREQPELDW